MVEGLAPAERDRILNAVATLQEHDPDAAQSILGILAQWKPLPLPPPTIGNKPNPAYFQAKYQMANDINLRAIRSGTTIPHYDSTLAGIAREVKIAGFDDKSIQDQRSDADKLRSVYDDMMAQPLDALTRLDSEIQLLEEGYEKAFEAVERAYDKIAGQRPGEGVSEYELRLAQGKSASGLMRRILRLRKKIRNPRALFPNDPRRADIAEAARPLWFMLYVSRTNEKKQAQKLASGDVSYVLRIGEHHGKLALAHWVTLYHVRFRDLLAHKEGHFYQGMIGQLPPGHGKSEFAMACTALEACIRPTMQGVYLHAVKEQAEDALKYITQMLGEDSDAGLRRRSLYPDIQIERANSKMLQLRLDSKLKSPTLRASSTSTKALGSNVTWLVIDDAVPKSDRDQPAERERRKSNIGGTWMTRLRGGGGYVLIIGTVWHPDDYLAGMIREAESGKGSFLLTKGVTGGPTSNPPFASLWPDVYPPSVLKRMYETIKDPEIWACNYEGNPTPESTRVIHKLRYYDPLSTEHTDFLASAQFHISADPTATNRENADRAGLVYAAFGEIVTATSQESVVAESRLRILDATEQHWGQVQLADGIAAYSATRPTSMAHIETRGGYHATADILENKYGIVAVRHDPTNVKKMVRVKRVAGLIDDSLPGLRAQVEFPGMKMHDGTIGPDQRWQWLYEQFLNFGFAADHTCDAVVQLVKWGVDSGILVAGDGEVSRQAVRVVGYRSEARQRLAEYWKQIDHEARNPDDDAKRENEWIHGMADGGL